MVKYGVFREWVLEIVMLIKSIRLRTGTNKLRKE